MDFEFEDDALFENITFDVESYAAKFDVDIIEKYSRFRWFNCSGEARVDEQLKEDSILCKGEEEFIGDDLQILVGICHHPENGQVQLFGHTLNRGTALLANFDRLCRFALSNFMALNSQIVLLVPSGDRQGWIAREKRKSIVEFFLYIRDFLLNLVSSPHYHIEYIGKHLGRRLIEFMTRFGRNIKKLVDLPGYMCNYTAVPQASRILQPYHHVFHCHLEVRWLLLTSLHLAHKVNNIIVARQNCSSELRRMTDFDFVDQEMFDLSTVLEAANRLVSELVQLAILRFEKLGAKEAMKVSAFNCSCVQELWTLLKVLLHTLEKADCDNNVDSERESVFSFWKIVNKILFQVTKDNNDQSTSVEKDDRKEEDTVFETLPPSYSCCSPNLFKIWLVKCLSHSFSHNNRDISCNYVIIEKSFADELKLDCSEAHLRFLVSVAHFMVLDIWKPRNELICILWDYYHRRLNHSCCASGSILDSATTFPRTSDKLISQVYYRLEDDKLLSSFEQFVRMLGLHLQRACDEKRLWNQIKGRIYTKFGASKMNSLSKLGVYRFVTLMLTLAVVKTDEMGDICDKLQVFLQSANTTDKSIRCLVLQTNAAILNLLAKNSKDFSTCAERLNTNLTDLNLHLPENVHIMADMIDSLEPLWYVDKIQSGLLKLVGDWLHRYLIATNSSKLIQHIDRLLDQMKARTYRINGSQEVDIFEALWKQMKTFITSHHFKSATSDLDDVGIVCANFAVVSTKVYRSATMLRDVTNIVSDSTLLSASIYRAFLTNLVEYKPLPMALYDHDTFILTSWIRCELFDYRCKADKNDRLLRYVVDLRECNGLNFKLDPKEPLISFCKSLCIQYSSLKQDTDEKQLFYANATRAFMRLKHWLELVLKVPNVNLLNRVYFMVGGVIATGAGVFMYSKLQTADNTLRQVIDLLLLPPATKRPNFKMADHLLPAVNRSLYLFVEGLVKIKEGYDVHLAKMIEDLIVIYVQQCVVIDNRHHAPTATTQFSLAKCFRPSLGESRVKVMKTVLETLRDYCIIIRVRQPSKKCRQALRFLHDVLIIYKYDVAIVMAMLDHVLDHVCCIIMHAEDSSPAKREAANLLEDFFDCHPLRSTKDIQEKVMNFFAKMCREHLPLTSAQLMAIFKMISGPAPDFVYRFIPQLQESVRFIEKTRGINYDRVMRSELAILCKELNYH